MRHCQVKQVRSAFRLGLLCALVLMVGHTPAHGKQKERDAAFVSQSVPRTMTAGKPVEVSVTFRNTGTATWAAKENYRLGSQNPQDNTIWGFGRVDPASRVAPSQSNTFTFTVTPPTTPGTYNFQWQMLQDGVEWFGQTSTNVAVTVKAP
jgi:hypothetical protein